MIISHKYKYLFVELPRTGSTAISAELTEFYDGQSVLHKHATYLEFLKTATPEEKQYFVFSGIRNPLDDAVSLYFKYKTDHKSRFSNPAKLARQKGLVGYISRQKFKFIRNTEVDFPTYLRKYYKIPYNNWSGLSHKQFDHIIRFENLVEDFAQALHLIGIEPVRPLPLVNPTGSKKKDFLSYYTPDIVEHARNVFGPFMQEWGYEFPAEWGNKPVPWWSELEYKSLNVFRVFYWKYMRPRIHSAAGDN